MNRARVVGSLAVALLCLAGVASAQGRNGLDVELWTNRGQDAVYQPGDPLEVKVKTSDDAYLLVYEIDAVGNVRLIAPEWGSRGFVPGGETFDVPSPHSDMELVVDGPVGQGFLVAIASREPFEPMPWYLRPYNAQADEIGYQGGSDDDEDDGVTADGKIVGDPFVAMERIRRRVLRDPEDEESFATAYTSYYVHHAVRYPRYICNDCHRPGAYAWWDGFDPYYTTCSVIDFRVNWGWGWGPGYWFGYVPYYYYVVRADCPPRYRMFSTHDACFSSWDGRRRWNTLWGDALQRGKTAPPPGYIPPNKYDGRTIGLRQPPGFLGGGRTVNGQRAGWMPTGREIRGNDGRFRESRSSGTVGARDQRAGGLLWRPRGDQGSRGATRDGRLERQGGRQDASTPPGRERGNVRDWIFGRGRAGSWQGRNGGTREQPSQDRGRFDRPAPGYERPRDMPRPSYDMPRNERPRASEMPWQRSRGGEEGRSSMGRERSQPRYEAPRSEPARPQRQEAPQRVERQEGGRNRGEDGGRGHGRER